MKIVSRILFLVLLQFCVLPLAAADAPKTCTFCFGVVEPSSPPVAPLPAIVYANEDDFATAGTRIDALSADQRRQTTLVVTYKLDGTGDALTNVEQHTKNVIEFARLHGPFDALAIDVKDADTATTAYAVKRVAVTAQGLNIATRIAALAQSPADLAKLMDGGAGPYFDVVIANSAQVPELLKWLVEKDPSKKIWATVTAQSTNKLYDLARAIADGATRAYLDSGSDAAALANANRAFIGDWAYDATTHTDVLDAKGNKLTIGAITFIRGEDLRSLIVPQGSSSTTIVSLDSDLFDHPRRFDANGEREITDSGRKARRFLVGVTPMPTPYLLTVEHTEKPTANVKKETVEVTTTRGISVEEIIRNHQAYKSYEESIQPRYIAYDTTKLRFLIGDGGDAVEAAIAGDYFSDPAGRADWVWKDFYLNGVKWKYGRIPELPLIQPEKVSQLPLDIHLTNEYRYQLIRETDLLGYHTYEVRFDPPLNAPASLPLYRGTVWIDTRTFARIRLSMVQLNLTGEVLSNEERVDFQPFVKSTHALMTPAEVAKADARDILWLPLDVEAQQVISAAGHASPVLRSTAFTNFRIEPADFETALAEASKSDARMVRETKAGLRYLEKKENGERVVKEGFDTSQVFLLGGIHHDKGLDYPVVPLGGVDYFNFDLGGHGIQTNVFFAGVILAANATNPNVANTRTNLGVDLFALAIPFTNSMFRNGIEQKDEAVKARPFSLTARAGHPIFNFGKIDVSFTAAHISYREADDTAPGFIVPSSTWVLNPSIQVQYVRWGWTATAEYNYSRRTSWRPWGDLSEYNPNQKSFVDYGASIGKSVYLPKFQRIGVDVNYLDGQRLDRFSKYELGYFGANRVHGVESGSVRAERAILGHLSYGFVFSDQFRLEAFYDHALVDDKTAGYRREPFQGLGIGGQTVGPYGTVLRLDIGKTIGTNKQSGFVANVVVLKLF